MRLANRRPVPADSFYWPDHQHGWQ